MRNIIFNLIALALLLTVIILLSQVLKKPRQETQVKAVAALPAATQVTAEVALPAPPPIQIPLEPEPKAIKAPEPQTVVEAPSKDAEIVLQPAPKIVKAPAPKPKKAVRRAELEVSLTELDGEEARQKYLEQNRSLSRLSNAKPNVETKHERTADEYVPFETR